MSLIRVSQLDAFSINLSEIKGLFQQCEWNWLADDSLMLSAFNNSFGLFGAFKGEELVGFARVISDENIYAFLVDMLVDPNHRKLGIGTKMIEEINRTYSVKGIKVIASKEGYPIYKKNGFLECPPEAPGMVKFLSPKY
jgi:GNAT superfamily N-acetyltransferase